MDTSSGGVAQAAAAAAAMSTASSTPTPSIGASGAAPAPGQSAAAMNQGISNISPSTTPNRWVERCTANCGDRAGHKTLRNSVVGGKESLSSLNTLPYPNLILLRLCLARFPNSRGVYCSWI